LKTHPVRNIFLLAWPIILGQLGHMMASIADNVMVGHLGSDSLAAVAFANTLFALFILFGFGVANGITPLIGKAHGEKNDAEKTVLFKHGFAANILVASAISAIMLAVIPFMPLFDQPQIVLELAVPYYLLLVATVPFTMLFFHLKQSGEGIYITKPTMIITIAGNLINILLNFVFIYGIGPIPAFGVLGAGIATLLSRIIMTAALFMYMSKTSFKTLFQGFNSQPLQWGTIGYILKNSIPIGFQYIIEISAFVIGTIMVGWLGTVPLASHQIAINLVSITYLVANGIAAATTMRVSNLRGLGAFDELLVAAKAGTKAVIGFMVTASVVFLLGYRFLPALYIDELPVIELASKLLLIGVLFQLFDGLQVVALGILRGLNDLKVPTYIALISYWVIGLPVSYIFGIKMGWGTQGVWYGYLAGLAAASLLLYGRFVHLKSAF
jgi:MATE family multidrug resistance protein